MNYRRKLNLLLVLGVVVLYVSACAFSEQTPSVVEETAEPEATATDVVIAQVEPTATTTPSYTPKPTFTPKPPTSTPTRTPTPTATRRPTRTPLPTPVPDWYDIQSGDTLGKIAYNFDISPEVILTMNDMTEDEPLIAGHRLALPSTVTIKLPKCNLIHDSELVYGRTYLDWDTSAFIASRGGYLAGYYRNGLSAGEIIDRVADTYHVGPRALLATMELLSGWVTRSQPSVPTPFNLPGSGADLHWHASWAAKKLMEGYYGQLEGRRDWVIRTDGNKARLYPGTSPGSAAVLNLLAAVTPPDRLEQMLEEEQFEATYYRLFGDIEGGPVLPPDGKQPYFALPWEESERWVFTGGPHGGYNDIYSGWGALDFAPPIPTGCFPSVYPIRAVAPGIVVRIGEGQVWVDLDKDNDMRTGWVILYMHIATEGRAEVGTRVDTGDPLGFPSCEGGYAEASHLHIARMYDRQWMPAEVPVPFQLGNWTAKATVGISYDGSLTNKAGDLLESCDCRSRRMNVFPVNNYDKRYPTFGH